MNIYKFITYKPGSALTIQLVAFTCEAENILEADKKASAFGIDPLKYQIDIQFEEHWLEKQLEKQFKKHGSV